LSSKVKTDYIINWKFG